MEGSVPQLTISDHTTINPHRKINKREIGYHARPRRASQTSPKSYAPHPCVRSVSLEVWVDCTYSCQ